MAAGWHDRSAVTAGADGPAAPVLAMPGRPRRARRVSPVAGFLAGAAASTFATAVAAGVAGFQANRNLQPVEFTLRVGLLLAAPCIGAMLATLVLPRWAGSRPAWAIGAGVAIGPLLVLRMDRLLEYGTLPAAAGIGALAAWVVAGAAVATGSRPGTEHSALPHGPAPLDDDEHDPGRDRPGLAREDR
jgi:hypothetical protein